MYVLTRAHATETKRVLEVNAATCKEVKLACFTELKEILM